MGREIGLDEHYRVVRRELDEQAERLKVRQVLAKHPDGTLEALNIIQTHNDDGIIVYVEAPSPQDRS